MAAAAASSTKLPHIASHQTAAQGRSRRISARSVQHGHHEFAAHMTICARRRALAVRASWIEAKFQRPRGARAAGSAEVFIATQVLVQQ